MTTALARSPAEILDAANPAEKTALLLGLLRELIEVNGGEGLIPVEDEAGKYFGYYVPPAVAAEQAEKYGPSLTPEREAELRQRIADDRPGITLEELMRRVKTGSLVGCP